MKGILFLVLCFACSSVFGQRIMGRIVNQQKEPMEYVNVVLLSLPDSVFMAGVVSAMNGSFAVERKETKESVLRISAIGYVTKYVAVEKENVGTLVLDTDAHLLGEVVVKGDLPKTRIKGNAVLTTVAGTLLEKAGTAENLLDKIPGVSAGEGNVFVFGRGEAVTYINGREVRDASELDRLSSDNIKSVEVIRTPGARYAASVKAVVRIVTKKAQGEGLGGSNRTVVRYRKGWSWTEQFDFNYRKGKFDLFGSASGGDGYSRSRSDIRQDTYLDKHWQQQMGLYEKERYLSAAANLGMNYVLDEKNAVGGSYRWNRTPKYDTDSWLDTQVFQDDDLYEETNSVLGGNNRSTRQSLNLYYSGQLKKWTVNLNMDGVWSTNKKSTGVVEYGMKEADNRKVEDKSVADNTLYAGKLLFSHPLAGGALTFGGEYAGVQRSNDYRSLTGTIDDDFNEIKENTASGFVEYTRLLGKVYMQVGLRYEHVDFDYYENGFWKEEQSKTYNQLFPALSLSSKIGKVQLSLSYKEDVARPGYHMLRGNMQYNNRYTYESGNPLLQPSLTHNVQFTMAYKWLMMNSIYKHTENAVIWDSYSYSEEAPTVSVLSLKNAPSYDSFVTYVYGSKKWGICTPELGIGFQQQWYSAETPFGVRKLQQPTWMVQAGSEVELPGDILLTAKFDWQSHHHSENTLLTKDDWSVRLILYKSFLKNRLSLQLYANDIFNSGRSDYFAYLGKLRTMSKHIYPNSRSVSLTVRYKFNATRSKYKGTGAGAAQKSRM